MNANFRPNLICDFRFPERNFGFMHDSRRIVRANCLQTMESLPTVLLKPGEADRIVAGHPWIYPGEILRLTAPVADGEIVQVKDHRQRLLGIGFFNSKSKIHVRMLAPERVEVDEKFFEERIRAALAVRQKHLPNATSFRVVNAESDFLSGLIVDKYEDVLVVQISALGMDKRKAQIVAALQKIFSPRAIMERSDVVSRKFEGLQESNGILSGELNGPVSVNLNGLKFETDLIGGHKTGMYLDQQVNYQAVSQICQRRASFGLLQFSRRIRFARGARGRGARPFARPKRGCD